MRAGFGARIGAAGSLAAALALGAGLWASLATGEAAAQTQLRPGEPPEPGRVYTGDGIWIGGLPDLAARLAEARFVAIGETHDNLDHHRIQAALTASFKPEILAFEMIPQAMEEQLADLRAVGASRARLGAALEWDKRGWAEWDAYAAILEAAPWASVTGGGLPSEILRKTSAEGISGAPQALVERYGLAAPLPPEAQAQLRAIMDDSHCGHLPASRVEGMTAVQRLWDASFAEAWGRGAGDSGRGVLIAGAGHVRSDWASPALMRRVHPEDSVKAVGLFGWRSEARTLADYDLAPYDFIVITEPDPERPDPCAGLRAAAEARAAVGETQDSEAGASEKAPAFGAEPVEGRAETIPETIPEPPAEFIPEFAVEEAPQSLEVDPAADPELEAAPQAGESDPASAAPPSSGALSQSAPEAWPAPISAPESSVFTPEAPADSAPGGWLLAPAPEPAFSPQFSPDASPTPAPNAQ